MSEDFRSFYWYTGDRYACIEVVKDTIAPYLKEGWALKSFENPEGLEEILPALRTKGLFGTKKVICIIDGKMPSKILPIIKGLDSTQILIVIEKSPSKNSTIYKDYNHFITNFPVVMSGKYPDEKAIPTVRTMIKQVVGWVGNDEIFEQIFEECEYDFGKTINEIEKIRLYFDSQTIDQDVDDILYSDQNINITPLVSSLKQRNRKQSWEYLEKIKEMPDHEAIFAQLSAAMIEHLTFLQRCHIAHIEGFRTEDQIAEFIARNWSTELKPIDKTRVSKRLYFFRAHIENTDLEYCRSRLSLIQECFKNKIEKKGTILYNLSRMISKIP